MLIGPLGMRPFRMRLCDLQTVPASLGDALGDRPDDDLGIGTRKMIQSPHERAI